ncbi:trehalase family glycosidase [Sphaerisporangium flaviroseum]|uniref:Trehalase family glycosidase n=1 Tax=Sphaerisporangium flaviroseum TaxID=509199 RepID=A0ABP7IR51_9ACTN
MPHETTPPPATIPPTDTPPHATVPPTDTPPRALVPSTDTPPRALVPPIDTAAPAGTVPPNHAALVRQAVRVLVANWERGHTVPSRRLYPHQWSWDSAFITIGNARWSPRRARSELLTLFGAQWRDGRVPHIVFNPDVPESAYFPGPGFWDVRAPCGAATSGIVQPPVHAPAAWRVYLADPDRAFLRRIYPRLVAQQEFLRTARRSPEGLLSIVHPWESGMDNSPAWDVPLAAVDPGPLHVERRDLAHVSADERPTDRDYARYTALALAYRDTGYLRAGAFAVQDPLFNAAYGAAEAALAKIAAACGLDPAPHHREAARMTAAMVEHLYADGLFHARDALTGRLLRSNSAAGLVPLILPDLPRDIAGALIGTALGRFQFERGGLLPSFAPGTPEYDPARYWRGPSWLNLTWLVWQGLRHRRPDLAASLAEGMIRAVAHAGMREYFDPITLEGHGCLDFSWSAALFLDVVAQHGLEGVAAPRGQVAEKSGSLTEVHDVGDHVLA